MGEPVEEAWKERLVPPEKVLRNLDSGMSIFIGSGAAEPKTLIDHLVTSESVVLKDLELIQLISYGKLVSPEYVGSQRFRLKTFYSGGPAGKAIDSGLVDYVPTSFSKIPALIESGQIPIDAAFFQITPPNAAGYCSLGISVDAARSVMAQAKLVVGEVNPDVPCTFGDTFIPVSDFDFLISSKNDLSYLDRSPHAHDDVLGRVAANTASIIDDGSCLAFYPGLFFDALGTYLAGKHYLSIQSPFFTDTLMELMDSGVIRGKSLTSYAVGSRRLMSWLDRNPRVDFQALDKVLDPVRIGKNRRFMAILPVRKVDLYGRGIKSLDKKRISFNMLSAEDLVQGATLSDGGKVVFALPSRDSNGDSNIRLSVERFRDLIVNPEAVDMVATEYGVASLSGRTVRERAQALIDIAHPGDREELVEEAKKKNILYSDQIFLAECSYLYPSHIANRKIFKDDVDVLFRAIRPSDEEAMRRLFYRFSDEAIFYRYFSPIKVMPHTKMQKYVNADCNIATSIVGVLESNDQEQIIAEARFVRLDDRPYAEVAFLVEEKYQGLGIGTYLFKMLIRLAKERGLRGFTADVLPSNQSMVKVFEKGGHPVHSKLMDGLYHITIPFHKKPMEEAGNYLR